MMKHILFMPDGNRRYAKKQNISLYNSYKSGAKSLQLFSDFFLLENSWNQMTMHLMSKYTHERNDGSLEQIYLVLTNEFTNLYDQKYYLNNNIHFQWIDHSNKLPSNLVEVCQALERQTVGGGKISRSLLGYDLQTDEKNAFDKARDYEEFTKLRLIPKIDLVLRTTEMRPSKGPVYAMSQAQMILIDKLNPELTRTDLENVLKKYKSLQKYRQMTNPSNK